MSARKVKPKRGILCRSFPAGDNRWFYLGLAQRGFHQCSFHDGTRNQHVHSIPIARILSAMQDAGILDMWDKKTRKLRRP